MPAYLANISARIACIIGYIPGNLKVAKISFIMLKVCSNCTKLSSAFAPFLGSSMVEHSAVNRRVVGSNPTRGANMEETGN